MYSLSPFSGVIESTFKDTMTVFRKVQVLNDDKTTSLVNSRVIDYDNKPCRLSFGTIHNLKDTDVDGNYVKTNPKLFYSKSVILQPGDEITIQILDDNGSVLSIYSGQVGLPSTYVTHSEASITLKDTI